MNLIIAVINEHYGAVVILRTEETYQKRCAVLCELQSVFGAIAKKKLTNILVTRQGNVGRDASNRMDKATYALKKRIKVSRIDTELQVAQLKREVSLGNTAIDSRVSELTLILEKGLNDMKAAGLMFAQVDKPKY